MKSSFSLIGDECVKPSINQTCPLTPHSKSGRLMLLYADVLWSGRTALFEGLLALDHSPSLQIVYVVGTFCMLFFGLRKKCLTKVLVYCSKDNAFIQLELRSKLEICFTTNFVLWLCKARRPKYNKSKIDVQKIEVRAFRLCGGCTHVTPSLEPVSVGWAVHMLVVLTVGKNHLELLVLTLRKVLV